MTTKPSEVTKLALASAHRPERRALWGCGPPSESGLTQLGLLLEKPQTPPFNGTRTVYVIILCDLVY